MRGPGLSRCKVGRADGVSTAEMRHCVRRARAAAGLSREAAALEVTVSSDTIWRWETGRTQPDWEDIKRLLRARTMGPFFRAELARAVEAA